MFDFNVVEKFKEPNFLIIDDTVFRFLQILIFFIIAGLLANALFGISFAFWESVKRTDYSEKVSSYECGFNSFGDARETFDIRFYLVAILFLIFDLEVGYLFPWAVSLDSICIIGFIIMVYFLLILTIGFLYEWIKGALEWA